MPARDDDEVELESLDSASMEEEEARGSFTEDELNEDDLEDEDPISKKDASFDFKDSALDRRTKRKLDFILLPFLALLFLLNSVDKSNIGNAETAGFTRDAGLNPGDLNESLGYFFAFFVALQPIGAAFGRKFGMVRWVPACMSLWGVCTLMHIRVRRRWQLILLRIAIACLEAGFYPTTVAYLSLFYTRYEFAVRLSVFYGQTAVAGVLGAVLSWAIFSKYEGEPEVNNGRLKGWQVLFLIEGCSTIVVALLGFVWLPRSAETAWFLNGEERAWAEKRIRLDYDDASRASMASFSSSGPRRGSGLGTVTSNTPILDHRADESAQGEAHHRLLGVSGPDHRDAPPSTPTPLTADSGLSKHDILSAILNYKIWHILACNILSAIPATAFSVFLPLVMRQLSPSLNLAPSASNLLSAPPFAFGAIMLFTFATWSDRSKKRLRPIFCGLLLLLIGLSVTLLVPTQNYILRYISLCILLSGSFIASPLTVAWLTNNTPEPGKRSIVLGINGWGNLGGVFLSVLFTPEDRLNGYIRPFIITLLCALASFAGYIAFWVLLLRENRWREDVVAGWSEADKEREEGFGDVPVPLTLGARVRKRIGVGRIGLEDERRGDEKLTFRYGL